MNTDLNEIKNNLSALLQTTIATHFPLLRITAKKCQTTNATNFTWLYFDNLSCDIFHIHLTNFFPSTKSFWTTLPGFSSVKFVQAAQGISKVNPAQHSKTAK